MFWANLIKKKSLYMDDGNVRTAAQKTFAI
jgi:hypothetical protein